MVGRLAEMRNKSERKKRIYEDSENFQAGRQLQDWSNPHSFFQAWGLGTREVTCSVSKGQLVAEMDGTPGPESLALLQPMGLCKQACCMQLFTCQPLPCLLVFRLLTNPEVSGFLLFLPQFFIYYFLPLNPPFPWLPAVSVSSFQSSSSPVGLTYLAPWWWPPVPGLLHAEQLDGCKLQESGPGVPASPSMPKKHWRQGGCCTATCLLGRSQLVFSLALRFFLVVLLGWEEVWRPRNCQHLVLCGHLIALGQWRIPWQALRCGGGAGWDSWADGASRGMERGWTLAGESSRVPRLWLTTESLLSLDVCLAPEPLFYPEKSLSGHQIQT